MQTQNQKHISWKPKKETFTGNTSTKWKQSVFVPKYLNKETEEEPKDKEKKQ